MCFKVICLQDHRLHQLHLWHTKVLNDINGLNLLIELYFFDTLSFSSFWVCDCQKVPLLALSAVILCVATAS